MTELERLQQANRELEQWRRLYADLLGCDNCSHSVSTAIEELVSAVQVQRKTLCELRKRRIYEERV